MKKIFSFTIAFLLVTLICLPAFSADTTFEGEYRIRSYSEWNFEKKFNDIDKAQFDGWFEQRFRIKITHTRSEYLKAVVMLDLVEDTWGQGRAMYINNSNTGEYINWAYLEFSFPKLGSFRVGKFPVKWGHGLMFNVGENWQGLEGVEWSKDWGPVSTTVLYYKNFDGVIYYSPSSPYYNRDRDFIGLKIAYSPAENHLIELFGGWSHHHFQELGFVSLAYTGNIADMIDLKFEAGVGFGSAPGSPGVYDDYFGYSIYLDASYYNDLFRIGLAFLMMSGREDLNTGNMSRYAIENFKWGNIIGNEVGLNSPINANYWHLSGSRMENITSVKLYFEICPTDRLTINAAVIWARFTEDVGSMASNAFYNHPALYYGVWSSGWVYDTPIKSRDLGWEVDLGFSYEIMEGLTFSFDGGVLFTGDAWDYTNGVVGPPGDDWGEIWSVVNTLTYEF